jgi:hypothetical protein
LAIEHPDTASVHKRSASAEPITLRRLTPFILLAAAVLGIAAILRVANPFAANSVLPPCLFHALTHLYCPGCGVTRALYALLHGDIALAFRMNAMAMLAIPLMPAMLVKSLRPGNSRLQWILDARLWLVLVLCFFVLRNIPLLPFSWLAPG